MGVTLIALKRKNLTSNGKNLHVKKIASQMADESVIYCLTIKVTCSAERITFLLHSLSHVGPSATRTAIHNYSKLNSVRFPQHLPFL